MTGTQTEPSSSAISSGLLAPELTVIDCVLDLATCRALVDEADEDRWLSTTAEIDRSSVGIAAPAPRRVNEPSRPCRLLNTDVAPRFAVVDDPILALRLFYRLAQALPATRQHAELAGLKPLLRCRRYLRGEGTEAHSDPERETSDGQRSQLSMLMFLNDDFTGGAVEFPTLQQIVTPKAGRALVFPHGLLHRDQTVELGRKFVLEAEVFYSPDWQPYRR